MSATVRINLLPHREQKRAARQRQFISIAISLAILGLAIVGLVHGFLGAQCQVPGSCQLVRLSSSTIALILTAMG